MKDEGKNGLFVLEYARYYFDGFAQLADDFDIHIVVTYRRLYEWLPSAWSEKLKHFDYSSAIDNEENMGRLQPPRPYDFHEDYYGFFYDHPAQQVITAAERIIGKRRFSYSIIDMHAKHSYVTGKNDNLMAELLCSGAVPNTYYSCLAVKNKKLLRSVKGVEANTRLEVHYQTLAYKAYKLRLTLEPPTIDTVFKLQKCLSRDQAALDSLSKVCMSEKHTGKLYILSWEQEKKLFPERDEKDHRSGFEEYYRDRKVYCSIDVDDWLTTIEWRLKIMSCLREE